MEAITDFASGPLFRFAITLGVLGMGVQFARAVIMRRMGIKPETPDRPPRSTVWMALYWLATIPFHLGLVVVPLTYVGHTRLLGHAMNLEWPHFTHHGADIMTMVTIVAGLLVVVLRLSSAAAKAGLTKRDLVMAPLAVIVFVTGYMTAHIPVNGLDPQTMTLLHVLASDVFLILLPFTWVAHVLDLKPGSTPKTREA